jgi:hypothetical protein
MEFCLPLLVSNARSGDQSCPIPDKPASHRTHRVHTLASSNEKVVQSLQHDNMHKFKYYKTLQDKIVQILQDDNMHK